MEQEILYIKPLGNSSTQLIENIKTTFPHVDVEILYDGHSGVCLSLDSKTHVVDVTQICLTCFDEFSFFLEGYWQVEMGTKNRFTNLESFEPVKLDFEDMDTEIIEKESFKLNPVIIPPALNDTFIQKRNSFWKIL